MPSMEKPHPFFFPALIAIGVLVSAGSWFYFKPSGKEVSRLVAPAVKAQYLPDATGRLPVNTLTAEKTMATSMTVNATAPMVAAKKAP
jgi:hypothetical protein